MDPKDLVFQFSLLIVIVNERVAVKRRQFSPSVIIVTLLESCALTNNEKNVGSRLAFSV